MANKQYKQCTLEREVVRDDGDALIKQVSWIPKIFAKLHKILMLKNDAGKWENGWKVVGVGEETIDEPPNINKRIKNHRKNTGDSLT